MISVRRRFQSLLLTKLKVDSYSTHFYVVFYRDYVPGGAPLFLVHNKTQQSTTRAEGMYPTYVK